MPTVTDLYLCYLLLMSFILSSITVDIQAGISHTIDAHGRFDEQAKCMDLKSQICTNLPYNRTIFPNFLGHATQEEADREVMPYKPLIYSECSKTFKLFICVLFFPVCNLLQTKLLPCKSLCEENKQKCEPIIQNFGYKWPETLDCKRFAPYSENLLCIAENTTEKSGTKTPDQSDSHQIFPCPKQLKSLQLTGSSPSFYVGKMLAKDCSLPCRYLDYLYRDANYRKFAKIWVLIWSVICFIVTGFAFCTTQLDKSRFTYPERPFVYIIGCYFVISAVYIVGYIAGDQLACQYNINNNYNVSVLTRGTGQNPGCAASFMTLYYFTIASSIWWLLLTYGWFLASCRQWAQEAVAGMSQYFHFIAWATPAAMTIALLILGEIEGDSLTGVCHTGITNGKMQLWFLLLPNCVCLIFGCAFLTLGFASLRRIRRFVKRQRGRQQKFEKLIMRVGFLAAFYILPACASVAGQAYECGNLSNWLLTWWARACRQQKGSGRCPEQPGPDGWGGPSFELAMVKYLSTFVTGVSFSFWIFSRKSCLAWGRLIGGSSRQQQQQQQLMGLPNNTGSYGNGCVSVL